jgi:hypothetical protein
MSRPVGLVIRVFLPEGWVERKHQPPGRLYQAEYGEPAGFLRLTVYDAFDAADNAALDARLRAVVTDVAGEDAGRVVYEGTGDSTLGRMYTVVFRNERAGMLQVWMSAGPKGSIFATYEMGGVDTVREEMLDAHGIMESADLDELDMTGLHSTLPRQY